MTAKPAKGGWSFFDWYDALLSLVTDRHITRTDFVVLARLARYGDGATGEKCRPTLDTLGRLCACGGEQVGKSLKRGQSLGVIRLVRRGGGYGEHAHGSEYALVAPALWTIPNSGTPRPGR